MMIASAIHLTCRRVLPPGDGRRRGSTGRFEFRLRCLAGTKSHLSLPGQVATILILWGCCFPLADRQSAAAANPPTRQEVHAGLTKAVGFFRQQVSVQGSYLWQYSADLRLREGEGRASRSTGWVQPPGTPTVGRAILAAYRATEDPFFLEAARETAHALVQGQLRSGGWDYRIEFDAQDRARYAYRVTGDQPDARNTSTLDDNTTQSAIRFLMEVDQTLGFADQSIHASVMFALDSLLKVQYPNGAWPQRFDGPQPASDYPVRAARYPAEWSREFPQPDYRDYYTFNDNTMVDAIATLFQAAKIYEDDKYLHAAERGGDFIILAQMPEPQPAWAQQYDQEMQPAWARRFEPPAITGGESQSVMRGLLMLYRETGKAKYLEPIPPAIRYLKGSQLADGRLARFYELQTNRPLYFTTSYELTYSDADLPTHYAFVVPSHIEAIQVAYDRLIKDARPWPRRSEQVTQPAMSTELVQQTHQLLDAMDERGAWVETGTLRYQEGPANNQIIRCRTFAHHVEVLSQYLAAVDEDR